MDYGDLCLGFVSILCRMNASTLSAITVWDKNECDSVLSRVGMTDKNEFIDLWLNGSV